MPLRIVHASDWHGTAAKLPFADVYFVTGDMYENYHRYDRAYCRINRIPWTDPDWEESNQLKWAKENNFRDFLENKDALVVLVRGNHDFADLKHLYSGGPTFEFGLDGSHTEVQGLKIAGVRGWPGAGGDWSDGLTLEQFRSQIAKLPMEVDFLLSHTPPHRILDKVDTGLHLGSPAISSYLNKHFYNPSNLRLHCFGHIHEQFGITTKGDKNSEIIFSNAAVGYNIFDWQDGRITIIDSKKI